MSQSPYSNDQCDLFSASYGTDGFDASTFSFFNDSSMDQYIATPDGGMKSPDLLSAPIEQAGASSSNTGKTRDAQEDVTMGSQGQSEPYVSHVPNPNNTSRSPINIPSQGPTGMENQLSSSYPSYQHFNMPYQHFGGVAHVHSSFFHPYKPPPPGLRHSRSPPTPLSPPLSSSPVSIGSRRHSGHFSSPGTAVSPTIISPMSAMSSTLPSSETSPQGLGWNYSPLPPHPQYSTTPINTMGHLSNGGPSGPGLSMVSGIPYPVSTGSAQVTQRKVARSRQAPRTVSGRSIQPVKKEEDDDDSGDDLDADSTPRNGQTNGLGFTPTPHNAPKGDVRKARIESEQRRRDELREGFKRLKEALPVSNQRPSKSSLLDRSVAHIQSIEAANHYMMRENDMLKAECEKLRQSNQELIHAVAMNARMSNSPGSGK